MISGSDYGLKIFSSQRLQKFLSESINDVVDLEPKKCSILDDSVSLESCGSLSELTLCKYHLIRFKSQLYIIKQRSDENFFSLGW